MIPVSLYQHCPLTTYEIRTSKYRKNEYISRYTTMNGAKMAFKIPMKMKRLLSLRTRVNHDIIMDLVNHSPINQGRSVLAL